MQPSNQPTHEPNVGHETCPLQCTIPIYVSDSWPYNEILELNAGGLPVAHLNVSAA